MNIQNHNGRRVFLDIDSLTEWDHHVTQRFPQAEKVPLMAKIRRDRFASLAAVWKGCFDVDADHRMGEELFVNAQAKNGQVRVALAEKTDPYHGALRRHEHLPGFSFDDCVPITGDQVRAPVRFKKARGLDVPADKPLTVRFELTRAEIFAYEWGTTGIRRLRLQTKQFFVAFGSSMFQ